MAAATEGAGNVCGRLLDLDGQPIAGGRAFVYRLDDERKAHVEEAPSDAEGRFTLSLPAGTVTLWADAPAHARLRLEDVMVFAGAGHDAGDLLLAPGTRLRGRVLALDGTPAAGALVTVQCFHVGANMMRTGPPYECRTGADGSFTTESLPLGEAEIEIRPSALAWTKRSLRIGGEPEHDLGELRLPATGVRVRGVLCDSETGRPLPGATIHVDHDREHVTITDADGEFDLTTHYDRVDMVCAAKEGYGESGTFVHDGDDFEDLDLDVAPELVLEGEAVDAETRARVPITHLDLPIAEADDEDDCGRQIDHEWQQPTPGRFRVVYLLGDPIAGCEPRLRITAAGYRRAEVALPQLWDLPSATELTVDLRRGQDEPPSRPLVTARILVRGTAAGPAWLRVLRCVPADTPGCGPLRRGCPVPDVIGHGMPCSIGARVRIPTRGDLWLSLSTPEHPQLLLPMPAAAADEVELCFDPSRCGAIEGSVANLPSELCGQTWVVAHDETVLTVDAQVRADGTFVLHGLPAGTWTLAIGSDAQRRRSDADRAQVHVQVRPGEIAAVRFEYR